MYHTGRSQAAGHNGNLDQADLRLIAKYRPYFFVPASCFPSYLPDFFFLILHNPTSIRNKGFKDVSGTATNKWARGDMFADGQGDRALALDWTSRQALGLNRASCRSFSV
ncbi:hypothetical protein RRG08_030510 [Elysia crispata]|uniref:Uncharacterized protein n=1 Tax=Elysia crispata TaxID=231223 RepID=A0AAE1ALM1_9GAST|nr:hypothetical protein RRG08_030510 [Elysia crispata]